MTFKPQAVIPCAICGKPSKTRKLCGTCYVRARRSGTVDNYPILTAADVFWHRVDRTGDCWLWLGATNDFGYGLFSPKGRKALRAHRVAYEMTKGVIPPGFVVMHSCDNPRCVRPEHLSVGTRGDNHRDAVSKRRNAFGERFGHARLSNAQVAAIRQDARPHREVAAEYGVDAHYVYTIRTGRSRKKG